MTQIDQKYQRLNNEREAFEKEKIEWYKDRKLMEQINKINDEVLNLNVSGVKEGFSVRKSLLCSIPESALEA